MKDDNIYFAQKDADECVETLQSKAQAWFNDLSRNRYLDKLRKSWAAYHGAYFSNVDDSHTISFDGEQGELVNLAVNHYRNIAQHILTMVTSSRPAFQARAVNTDSKTQVQVKLANNLLDYYMREKRLERYLKTAVEYGITMGAGYLKMEWNSELGEIHDYLEVEPEFDEEGNEVEVEPIPVRQGDVVFSNLSSFDVVFDSSKESVNDNDWVICRTFKNKYDLAAKYPEMADEIKALETKSDMRHYKFMQSSYDETVDIPVYEFFHKKTESMPNGRYMLYVGDDIVLMDSPMPYKKLPVYRISPSDILGTAFGYTPMFDLLPLQDAVNSLYSTLLTNNHAFGVQNLWVPRGADLNVNELSGGLNIIESLPGMKPEPLQLTQSSPETTNLIAKLEQTMETLSGVNSVARGNPEASLKSGNALALVQSQALQFISGLQQSYIYMIEDVGTGLIELLKDFASAPRVAAIVGKDNVTDLKEFTGDDISNINRVIVDVGNAMAHTAAGRSEMANNLLQYGSQDMTVEQYLQVMQTGKLELMTNNITDQNELIAKENERLIDGTVQVSAVYTDRHMRHIKEHSAVLDDPDLRANDPELIARVDAHIQEHLQLLRETNPDLLAIIGEQPLSPVGGSPVAPGTVEGAATDVPAGMEPMPAQADPAMTGSIDPMQGQNLPQPAEPPPVNDPRPLQGGPA